MKLYNTILFNSMYSFLAGICFEGFDESRRLSINDADFVDIIHTTTTLGFRAPLGHADFYPNNGEFQPGCSNLRINLDLRRFVGSCGRNGISSNKKRRQTGFIGDVLDRYNCGHYRAYEYFIESLTNPCNFQSYECRSWERFRDRSCNNNRVNNMGFQSVKPARNTVYYLNVNDRAPYCRGSQN